MNKGVPIDPPGDSSEDLPCTRSAAPPFSLVVWAPSGTAADSRVATGGASAAALFLASWSAVVSVGVSVSIVCSRVEIHTAEVHAGTPPAPHLHAQMTRVKLRGGRSKLNFFGPPWGINAPDPTGSTPSDPERPRATPSDPDQYPTY